MQNWQERNQTNYFCEYCNQFVRNNINEKKKHEATPKHKYSVQNYSKNKKKQDEFMSMLKNPQPVKQSVDTLPQKLEFSKNTSIQKQKQALQRQEQYDSYYKTGKVNSTTSGRDIPIHLLQHIRDEEEDEPRDRTVIQNDPDKATNVDKELTQSLQEIKKKQQDFEDDYYDNPDFFFTDESEQVDIEKLKKEENDLKMKIAHAKRDQDEEEERARLTLERKIANQEYAKQLDQSTGLGKWEDCEDVEIELSVQLIPSDIPSDTSNTRQTSSEGCEEVREESHARKPPIVQEYSHSVSSTAKKRKLDLLESLLSNKK
jgi:hypothetical protein